MDKLPENDELDNKIGNEAIIEAQITKKEDKDEAEIVENKEIKESEVKEILSKTIKQTSKQVGAFSLNYFKDILFFFKDDVKAIQSIFDYSFRAHVSTTMIHGLIMCLIPLAFGFKIYLALAQAGINRYYSIWPAIFQIVITAFALTVIFQWGLAGLLCLTAKLAEKRDVAFSKGLKAVNIQGLVVDPFIIITALCLLILPLDGFLSYLTLLVLFVGVLFSWCMFIKTIHISNILTGDNILGILLMCLIISLLMTVFIYILVKVGLNIIVQTISLLMW